MARNKLFFIIGILFFNTVLVAQEKILKVGDKAPGITAFKWVKGTPVTGFKKGQIYVVEFGATWCVPCAEIIPHLTELSEKYQNKINVIGFFVMELNNDPVSAKNPAYVSRVEKYVKKQGEKMRYNVGIDDPYKSMENAWIRAAGKQGVPHTFVIDKNGMIAWIGTGIKNIENAVVAVSSENYDLANAVKRSRELEALETPYDWNKLLLIGGNGGNDQDFLYRSVLAK